MTRPKKQRELEHKNIITLRLSDMELEYLDRCAGRQNVTRSEYLRMLILEKPIEVRYQIVAESAQIQKLCGEIGKIGSNLNQIAKYFNSGGVRSQVMEDQIHGCIEQLFDLRKEMIKVAGDCYGDIETQDK